MVAPLIGVVRDFFSHASGPKAHFLKARSECDLEDLALQHQTYRMKPFPGNGCRVIAILWLEYLLRSLDTLDILLSYYKGDIV